MDSKELRGLSEAYKAVYAPQKKEVEGFIDLLISEGYDLSEFTYDDMHEEYETLDEGLRSAIKGLFGGKKKEPEAQKPLSRGAQLRAKYNTGPEKTETSAKRKILDLTRKRAESDKKKYGDSTYSKSVATKSAAAHDKYLRAGYSKYGADRPDSGGMGGSGGSGSGNKARKRAAALNKESYDLYDIILSHLIDEGYADTQEAAERIMVNMSEEWRESIVETRMDPRGRPASGPMNVYANPKGKPSQARLDAIAAVEADNKKKTPEQRKKELDDYRERQMNNK